MLSSLTLVTDINAASRATEIATQLLRRSLAFESGSKSDGFSISFSTWERSYPWSSLIAQTIKMRLATNEDRAACHRHRSQRLSIELVCRQHLQLLARRNHYRFAFFAQKINPPVSVDR